QAYLAICEATIATFAGKNDRALARWHDALRHLPANLPNERLRAWALVSQLESFRGNDAAADHAYREGSALATAITSDESPWRWHLEIHRANHHALRANLVAAEQMLHYQLDHLGPFQHHLKASFHCQLAVIYLEWNELDRALHEAHQTIALLQDAPLRVWHIAALLFVAQVYWASGDKKTSRQTFDLMKERSAELGGENPALRAGAIQATQWAQTGQLPLLRDWVTRHPTPDHPVERNYGERDLRLPRLALLVADQRWDDA